ncbi:MAG TPA: hypothetical protein VHT92_08780 [Candidatus Cybelea sp.]|jgi:hypothetical protein|nr:hypothetical protein [Candidatus Cybelea sp.]
MSAITAASSLEDVCFAVCTSLEQAGTVAVLTGGSAATYYAPASYQSGDADFIIRFSSDLGRAGDAIRALGYREVGGTYHHATNIFTVEFPPGPLAIGGDIVRSYETVTRDDEILYVLSRTDCVRDRLAAFYFFSDRSALAAAVAVATSGPIDFAAIQRWSLREGEAQRFAEFSEAL